MKSLGSTGKVTGWHSTAEGDSETENGGSSGGPPVESISKMSQSTAQYGSCSGLSAEIVVHHDEIVVHHEMQQCRKRITHHFRLLDHCFGPSPSSN